MVLSMRSDVLTVITVVRLSVRCCNKCLRLYSRVTGTMVRSFYDFLCCCSCFFCFFVFCFVLFFLLLLCLLIFAFKFELLFLFAFFVCLIFFLS